MNEFEALEIVYNYRLTPDPAAAPALFDWTRKSGILHDPHTALGWSGVITGLVDRHVEQRQIWKALHGETVDRAFRLARHIKSVHEKEWADYLVFRWFILNTDREAWTLLLRAHHKDVVLAQAAQRCIERIMTGTTLVRGDGRPILNSQATVQGSYQFPDMRVQLMTLNEEFRRMTWTQRHLPFDMVPFSPEYKLRQREARAMMLSGLPVTSLVQ